MRVLFLSGWFPLPPNNGSKLRAYNLLRALARDHEVTLLSFSVAADADPNAPALRSLCRHVEVVPARSFHPRGARALLGLLRPTPRWLVETFSPEMAAGITRLLGAADYDLVIASETALAAYAGFFRGLPALFEDVELGVFYDQFRRAPSLPRRLRCGLTWAKHRRYVARLLRDFRACTVVSERERRLLVAAAPGCPAIEVIPNCVHLDDYRDVAAVPQPNTLIFTGSLTYFANHDAMTWFVREVYPRVQARVPRVQLTITGDAANYRLPAADNVILTGLVADVRPLMASSCVSLAPIRIGGGTRVKILEAMALGTPVVSTTKGAEGLEVVDGEHLLIADEPSRFADGVVRLLADHALREHLSRNARRLIEERYDWRVIGRRFEELVTQVAESPKTRSPD